MCRHALLVALVGTVAATAQFCETDKFTLEGELTSIALDPTDKTSFAGFANGDLLVFPILDKMTQQFFYFNGHRKAVTAGSYLPDGRSVASASLDGTVKVWDVAACVKYLQQLQATNGKGKAAYPVPKMTIQAHPSGVTALAVRADGNQFLTGGTDGSVKLWDAKSGKVALTIAGAHAGGVKAALYRPESEHLVTTGADKTVKTWDAKTGKPVGKSDPFKSAVNGLAVSPDGKKAAVGCAALKKGGPGIVIVLDLATLTPDFTMEVHDDAATCVVFHPKTNHLATGGADKTIRAWDLGTRERTTSDDNAEPLRGLAVTADGKRFAVFSATRLRWWDGFGAKE